MALNEFPVFPKAKSIVHEDFVESQAGTEFHAENDWVDARTTTSRARYSLLRDVYTLNFTDFEILRNFLRGQGYRATPFLYRHPLVGVAAVRHKTWEMPGHIFVDSDPPWVQIALEVEEV